MDIADDRKKSGEVKGLTSTGSVCHLIIIHNACDTNRLPCSDNNRNIGVW
jgi:hypothetical protein